MPLRCVEERRSPTQLEEDDDAVDCTCIWQETPDSILLHVFSFLRAEDLALVSQTCKKWKRVSYDECLWKAILRDTLAAPDCQLAPGKASWRGEVIRVLYHTPTVLTETLQEHTDEVLHVSFSHDGTCFSTTSKDATLKVWTVGHPTRLRYSKDFRELLGWDFTQFSCFNESDTMILVSSVKTSGYMDRRGFMAILSLVHDFEILRVVTMDPSQLFGAWLDDTTFLGGSLEISLDRFATTVQIEAYDVPEIFWPLPRLSPTPVIEESSGKPMFTFSSETASLIKFLTVADILTEEPPNNIKTSGSESSADGDPLADLSPSADGDPLAEFGPGPDSENLAELCLGPSAERVHLTELRPSSHKCRENEACCSYKDTLVSPDLSYTDETLAACSDNFEKNSGVTVGAGVKQTTTTGVDKYPDDSGTLRERPEQIESSEGEANGESISSVFGACDICKSNFKTSDRSDSVCDKCRESFKRSNPISGQGSRKSSHETVRLDPTRLEVSFIETDFQSCENQSDLIEPDDVEVLNCYCGLPSTKSKTSQRPHKLDTSPCETSDHRLNTAGKEHYPNFLNIDTHSSVRGGKKTRKTDFQNVTKKSVGKQKNLIFVTGEFAVALHQLGFKNMAPYTRESVLARGVTPMDEDNPDGFMVVNYSNNDIHIVRRQQETDKPDSLIDLFGHVTGLCLSADQRYLFINCRPWIGEVDRTDPWATPDLSPNIEVRIIDLVNLKDLGVRYVGHKGFSPSNMCCFVFLDVSQDYVASGSEDAKGYLWDRHYRSLLANFEHESGVVNAVGFNPRNQEYFVTVSDDGSVKVWRSKQEVKKLHLQ